MPRSLEIFLAGLALVCSPADASAELLFDGPEFQVNTYTTNSQTYSASIARDAAGDFVVVWASYYQDGSSYGLFGQSLCSEPTPTSPATARRRPPRRREQPRPELHRRPCRSTLRWQAVLEGVVASLNGNTAPTIQIFTSDGLCIGATMNEVKKDEFARYAAQLK